MTTTFRAVRFIVRIPQQDESPSYHEGLVDANGRKAGFSWAKQTAMSQGGVLYEADAEGNERVVRDYR